MRHTIFLVPFLLLAACQERAPEAYEAGQPAKAGPDDSSIACALAGAAEFRRVCLVERVDGEDGRQLVLRAPDGGFRRLTIVDDGRGVIAADGAEGAEVRIAEGGMIEVAVGEDRYLLPATIQGQ